MSKILLLVLFSAALTQAQEARKICPCDTEQDLKEYKDLWTFLRTMSKDVSKDMESNYAVPAGYFAQFDCSRCEKKRTRRELPNATVEEASEEVATKQEDRKKRSVYPWPTETRCAVGYKWSFGICIPDNATDEDY